MFTGRWGNPLAWLITDNPGEYTNQVVLQMLGDMDRTHVPTFAYDQEKKGIS